MKTVDPFAEEPVDCVSLDSHTQNQALYLKERFDASLKDVEDRQAVFNDALKFVIRSLQAELRALKTEVALLLGVQHPSAKVGAASTLQLEATSPTLLASDVNARSAAKDRAGVRTRIVNLDSCEPETPELSHEPANLEFSQSGGQFGAQPSLRDLVRSECEVVNARIFHELEDRLHKFDNELHSNIPPSTKQRSQDSGDSVEHTAEDDEIGRYCVLADDQAPTEEEVIGTASTFNKLNSRTEKRFSVRMGHVHDPVSEKAKTTELEDDIEFAMACFIRE